MWHTSPNATFVNLGALKVIDGQISIAIEPESMYTVTSTSGQSRGQATVAVAVSAPFPKQWTDSFDAYPAEGTATQNPPQNNNFRNRFSRGLQLNAAPFTLSDALFRVPMVVGCRIARLRSDPM